MAENSENIRLLAQYDDLRVADVRDALDFLGYHRTGSMNASIRPLFRTRAVGIARTVRYLPWNGRIPEMSNDDYLKWSGWYYGNVCTYPWIQEIEPGDMIVIDQSGVDAGLMGSENTLTGIRAGAVGFVSNGGVRDTDEIILQKVPFWADFMSQSMVQGRLMYDSRNVPVCVGGMTVCPGDIVMGDGDGVIVVPRDLAGKTAGLAHEEHERDKKARQAHYAALGREADATVK